MAGAVPGVPLAELEGHPPLHPGAAGLPGPTGSTFARGRDRSEGSFWPDFFNVRRVTSIKGWWFDALVVASDGTVLFRNVAGQARTDRVEKQTNPLGPVPAGGRIGRLFALINRRASVL